MALTDALLDDPLDLSVAGLDCGLLFQLDLCDGLHCVVFQRKKLSHSTKVAVIIAQATHGRQIIRWMRFRCAVRSAAQRVSGAMARTTCAIMQSPLSSRAVV